MSSSNSNDFFIVNDRYAEDYGFPYFNEVLGKNALQFHKELFVYKLLRGKYGLRLQQKYGWKPEDYGFKSAFTHLCNAIQLGLPRGVVELVSADGRYINDYLLTTLHTLCTENDIGAAGAASTLKTFGFSVFSVFDWIAAPECTTTLLGSTTKESLDDRIWGQTSSIFRQLKYKIGELVDYRRSIIYGKGETIDGQREYSNAIKCIAVEKGQEGRKVIENTRGRKNDRFRVFIDELAEMDMYVTDLRVNLAANEDIIFGGISNPLPGRNPHYELCLPDGQTSFPPEHRNWRIWKTRTGVCLFFSGEKSPNMRAPENEPPPFPYMMTRDKLATMLKLCYGNPNALEYWRNAIGGWAPAGIQMTVLTKEMLQNSNTLNQPVWIAREPFTKIASLDPSFTSGGDQAVLTLGFIGVQTQQDLREFGHRTPELSDFATTKRVAYIEKQISLKPSAHGDFIKNLAKEVVDALVAYEVKPHNFGLDVSGDGGIVAQAIMREWESRGEPMALAIALISSQGGATDRPVSDIDTRKCSDVYDRQVSEYWFSVAVAVQTRTLFGLDPDSECAEEFYNRTYTFKNRKQAVITKEEMKGNIGKSPDFSDSACYFWEMCRRNGVVCIADEKIDEVEIDDVRDPEFRYNRKRDRDSEGSKQIGSYSSDGWGEDC